MNPEPQLIKEDVGHYYLRGTVDFNTVKRLTHESILDGSEQINIDLGGLLSADSSAVALLIQWLRQATQEGVELRFLNIPEQIKPLIALYDLESIIQ